MRIKVHEYYVYILTNPTKTTTYIGVTNDLAARLTEHWRNRNDGKTFAGKFHCYNLIYFESFVDINEAIKRETDIKKWNRSKKNRLINSKNPSWLFLNADICGSWPPFDLIERF